jgi:hypothetical protein
MFFVAILSNLSYRAQCSMAGVVTMNFLLSLSQLFFGTPICSKGDNPPLCSGHCAPAGVLIEPGSYIGEKVMIRKS